MLLRDMMRNERAGLSTRLIEALRSARHVVALTGSGLSAESGIPTFRGVDGYWRRYRVEDLASPHGFARDPRLVWTWYNERWQRCRTAEPNPGHRALAELERALPRVTVVTQNVDGLHLRAGSRNVLELHGTLRKAYCTRCAERAPMPDDGWPLDAIDHDCGGRMRPGVVWFGEALPHGAWEAAQAAVASADVLLVVGTSALVYPAAGLWESAPRGCITVEINPEETPISDRLDERYASPAGSLLPQLLDAAQRR